MYQRRTYKVGFIEVIILINIAIFVISKLMAIMANTYIERTLLYGIGILTLNIPNYPFSIETGAVYQVVTALFLHGSLMHLVFNMYAFYMFGKPVEMLFGTKKFAFFYLTVGIVANIITVLIFKVIGSPIRLLGASGAVYGVVLAFATFYPESRLLLFGFVPVKTKWAMIGFVVLELIFEVTGFGNYLNVANFAHLLGIVTAFFYLLVVHKVNPIKKMFFNREDHYIIH